MHPNPDDLTSLERQLAACRPSTTGLDADAMVFAAGQATAQRRGARIAWPAIVGGFAFLSLALGAGLMSERSERLALADRLSRLLTAVVVAPALPAPPSHQPPSPDSYLASRRLLEQDSDAWLVRSDNRSGPPRVPPEGPPVLHAWPADSAILQP